MKMKGLFCFDGPMYRDKNGIYCNTTLTNEVFDRYLQVVDHLTIAIRTFVLDVDYQEANLHKIDMEKLTIVELPNLNSVDGLLTKKKRVKNISKKLIGENDLVFARMPSVISNIFIKEANRQTKKYLVEVGGCVWDAYWNHSIKGKIVAPLLYIKTRKYIKNADFSVYVTKNFLQKRYPNNGRIESCSNVSLPEFDVGVLKNRIEKIQKKNINEPIIIGTTAAINVPYKGQEYIIKAISKMKSEGYDFVYELVGVGDKEYLEDVARKYNVQENVKFLGVLLHDDVIEWLDQVDIYSQPSKQEGLPRALVEAMSRGCPSIGSLTAGIPELLSEDCVFHKGNVNEICEILKKFSKEKMLETAKINFEKSKEFDSSIIEHRRTKIFKEYADSVI